MRAALEPPRPRPPFPGPARPGRLKTVAAVRSAAARAGPMVNLKRVLWHLLGGTRGGPMRIRILMLLRDRPFNTNQIATELAVDYKTVQHHLRVLVENRVLSATGDGYGAVYLFTRDMEESLAEFDAIAAKVAPAAAKPSPPTSEVPP